MSILTRREWLCAGLLALSGCAGRSADERIWIGHVAAPSGRGESARDGMQQMLADLRDKKFTIGGRMLGVRHVEAKNKTLARAEASRLLAVNRVACLIVDPDVAGLPEVVAIARAHDSIAVVLGGTADRALAEQAVWLEVGAETRGEMLARYAISNGLKKYTSDLEADDEFLRGFAREFAKGSKPPSSKLGHLTPRVNFSTPVEGGRQPTFLRRGGGGLPELGGKPNEPDAEVWRLRKQPGPPSPAAVDLARGDNLLAGLAQQIAGSETLPANGQEWAARYEKRFGKPPDDDAFLGAEAVALIADGLKAVGDDRAKLTKELSGLTKIDGLTGAITRKDGRTRRPMWVERTVKGKRVAVERIPE